MESMNTKNLIETRERVEYSEEMARQNYTGVFTKKGRWILAWIEEIPGVNTQGRTMKEARENLREALSLVLEENRAISVRKHAQAHREKISITI